MKRDSISLSPEQIFAAPSAEPAPAEKAASPETPEDRYVRQVNAMLRDAIGCCSVEELADTLAWGIAIIASHAGAEVTGDIIYRLGRHIRHLAARDRAKAEAEQARLQGRLFQ